MFCPTEEEVMRGRETHSKISEQNRPDAWAAKYQDSEGGLVCVVKPLCLLLAVLLIPYAVASSACGSDGGGAQDPCFLAASFCFGSGDDVLV